MVPTMVGHFTRTDNELFEICRFVLGQKAEITKYIAKPSWIMTQIILCIQILNMCECSETAAPSSANELWVIVTDSHVTDVCDLIRPATSSGVPVHNKD